jgi:hypothetical protein
VNAALAHGLRKQKIDPNYQPYAVPNPHVVPCVARERNTIAMLQWLIQNGPLVAWAFAVLFTGFTMLAGKV